MAAYVVFGMAVFSTTQRRNRVANRAQNLATAHGFIPCSRLRSYPPGVTPFTHVATETGDGLVEGQSYPAVRFCYEHTDQQLVADAELLIQDEMDGQGWLYGNVGTWTDING